MDSKIGCMINIFIILYKALSVGLFFVSKCVFLKFGKKDNQNKIETVWVFPCNKDSERMANNKDPDQTSSSDKVIAFICFNFMNSFVILYKWIKHLQIEFDRA